MTRRLQIDPQTSYLALSCAAAALALAGCSGDPPPRAVDTPAPSATKDAASDGEEFPSEPIDKLPMLEGNRQVLAEPLAKPTALGENAAVHMRLPPPRDLKLADSLVRVVGNPNNLQLLFRADALAQLGVIPRSPGSEFFTSFAALSAADLQAVRRDEDELASGAFGETVPQSVVFDGRSALGLTVNDAVDPAKFKVGLPATAIAACPTTVVSTWQAWGKSLFITDPAVVEDLARTWNPCTGLGNPNGNWTFAHLMRQMSIGSLHTPEEFVQDWLSNWLNDYVVNGDIVPARTQMFNQVIKPWAIASGVTATLTMDPFTHKNVLNLDGPLNLDLSPMSLRAIVNRIDLGKSASGAGGYGGGGTMPTTPGELRFIFGVVQPNPWGAGSEATCGRKPFTVILEFGTPGNTCPQVVAWAKQWSLLQTYTGFTSGYLAQLDAMTESVVVHGAAPSKGNQSAINQIRTNEAALAWGGCGPVPGPWEMREFTLTNENPAAGTDLPVSGLIRRHTVALTPDDGTFSAGGPDPTINAFVATQVVPPAATPTSCATVATYNVPYSYPAVGSPFRGGNSLMMPSFWKATLNPSTPHNVCARHEFSLNTCDGCHHGETATNGIGNLGFTHIDPLSPAPVPLSKFLTGGGPGLTFNVNDPQYGSSTVWKYADLQRRLQRLFDLSHCTTCTTIPTARAGLIDQLQAMGPVPADIDPAEPHTFQVGPITSLDVVAKVLQLRTQMAGESRSLPADFARPQDASSH